MPAAHHILHPRLHVALVHCVGVAARPNVPVARGQVEVAAREVSFEAVSRLEAVARVAAASRGGRVARPDFASVGRRVGSVLGARDGSQGDISCGAVGSRRRREVSVSCEEGMGRGRG